MFAVPTRDVFTLEETKSKKITLTAYIAGVSDAMPSSFKRNAVLICPGGAYGGIASREGEPIAHAYLATGFNSFVLNYSVTNSNEEGKKFPGQLIEAARAIKFIKDNAEQFHIDPDCVFVCGFSAGGHLAASLGTLYNSEYVNNAIDMSENYARPAGMILGYPVITAGEYGHRGSFVNLLHEDAEDENKLLEVSLEKRVTKDTVPAFIWHTRTDSFVPVQNSLLFASALSENGIAYEMHIYPNGEHGLALATSVTNIVNPIAAKWFAESVRWMESISNEMAK